MPHSGSTVCVGNIITEECLHGFAEQADKDQELRSQKVATIRMMYEQVADEFEVRMLKSEAVATGSSALFWLLQKLKSDIQKSGNELLQSKIDQKSQLLRRLEEQLYTLTGIAAESQVWCSTVMCWGLLGWQSSASRSV